MKLLGKTLAEIERVAILNTLKMCKGNKVQTAKVLDISKTTLYRKLSEYGVLNEDHIRK